MYWLLLFNHTLFGRNPAGAGHGTTGRGRHVIDSSSPPLHCFGGGVIVEALLYVGSCVGGARHPPKPAPTRNHIVQMENLCLERWYYSGRWRGNLTEMSTAATVLRANPIQCAFAAFRLPLYACTLGMRRRADAYTHSSAECGCPVTRRGGAAWPWFLPLTTLNSYPL